MTESFYGMQSLMLLFILGPNRISIFNHIDLQLDVKGCRNIYDCLDMYVKVKRLEGDNKYYTE
jgi:hypothetical protein